MPIRRGILALVLAAPALLPGGPSLARPGSDRCERELALTEIRLRETSERLRRTRTATAPHRCAALRDHVRIMGRAAETFRRCTSGHHARENVAQMQGSIADVREIIARTCR